MTAERIRIEYVRIDQAALWDRNPKQHDIGALVQSVERYGFRDAPIYDSTLEAIVAGNGRLTALRMMMQQGHEPPRGIALDETGMWCAPVQFGIDAASRMQAEAFAIDHNNLVVTGGDTELWDILALYDRQALADIAASIEDGFVTLDSASVELIVGNNDDLDPDETIAWSFQVHFKTTRGEQKELVDLVGPYFMPRSRRKLMPEFFAAMLKSYAREGTPMVVVDG